MIIIKNYILCRVKNFRNNNYRHFEKQTVLQTDLSRLSADALNLRTDLSYTRLVTYLSAVNIYFSGSERNATSLFQ